jgi:hypothetical protein
VTGPQVGDRVRVERDEVRYPSRGSWPQFRGRAGTVVEVTVDRERPYLTEYGVVFGKARTDRGGGQSQPATCFKVYELVLIHALAAEKTAEPRNRPSRVVAGSV